MQGTAEAERHGEDHDRGHMPLRAIPLLRPREPVGQGPEDRAEGQVMPRSRLTCGANFAHARGSLRSLAEMPRQAPLCIVVLALLLNLARQLRQLSRRVARRAWRIFSYTRGAAGLLPLPHFSALAVLTSQRAQVKCILSQACAKLMKCGEPHPATINRSCMQLHFLNWLENLKFYALGSLLSVVIC